MCVCAKHFGLNRCEKINPKNRQDSDGVFRFSEMETQTLTNRARRQLSMPDHRDLFYGAKAFRFIIALLCTLFSLIACGGSCSVHGILNPDEYDACGSYKDNFDAGVQDVLGSDVNPEQIMENPLPQLSLENVCSNLNLFCFPSTLPGFWSEEHSPKSTIREVSGVHSDTTSPVGSIQARNNLSSISGYGMFKLSSGRIVSCSRNSQEGSYGMSSLQMSDGNRSDISSCRSPSLSQKTLSFNADVNSEMIELGLLDGSSSPHVEINPAFLDWGQKYRFFPSLAFLTVANTHEDIILNIYEPFSTDTQFYPCNFSEVVVGPGEVTSICFVFLPTLLGLSSAHLILQTSFGGFVIRTKGFGIESPNGIQPLVGLHVSSGGRWRKDLSLFNPSDDTLHVEEVIAWISVLSGNASHSTKAVCSLENLYGLDERRLDMSGQIGSPSIAMRPHGNWEIGPHSTETIIDIDYSHSSDGKIFGAFCMHLQKPSQDETDTVMIPFEAELGGKSVNNDLTRSVSVSLEVLVPCDASETIVSLSLKNGAPYLLNVVKINGVGERSKLFKIKYMEGLILFPGSDTQVAVVSYTPEISDINMNCKLMILTNDSSRPQIEIPCKDIVKICSRHRLGSVIGYERQSEKAEYVSARTRSLGSSMRSSSPIEALEMAEADELVLKNWKSQGTTSGMSVLDDHEVQFPMVQVGSDCSKWITVKNPSRQPVLMQLILNSGEIIDNCKGPDGLLMPSSSSILVHSESTTRQRHGFSISESALTEAYVHPHDSALFGPILFHPSSRCRWKSSALIRNNLSGVEWLPLRGFGGSVSLVLFDGSEAVESLDFKLNLPSPLNFSPLDISHPIEETIATCSKPLSKELYARNTGDLPLEVKRIEVSGTKCAMDGFVVHSCEAFALEPGESTKLQISYQTDFSVSIVQRNLVLVWARDSSLILPMTASLSIHTLNICKKSVFWVQVKKSFIPFSIAASVIFLILFFILPQLMALGSKDYLFKSGKSSISTVHPGNSSPLNCNQKKSNKLAVSPKTNGLSRSIWGEKTSNLESVERDRDGQGSCLVGTCKEMTLPPSALSKSLAIESSDVEETSKASNLTVKTGKEKGKRRRKKRNSGTGLIGLFEVSSSQSGNSTPSSPLSPVTSLSLKQSWPLSPDTGQSIEVKKPLKPQPEIPVKYCTENSLFTPEKSPAPRKIASKPLLKPSATFPSAGRPSNNFMCSSPFLASTATIAPHARAPGSKLNSPKTEENTGFEDQFKYDIWGDHFFGLDLMGQPKEVSSMTSNIAETNSCSFFVSCPQTLVAKTQPTSVSGSHQDG